MVRRYFNWTLAIVLVVAVVVFTGAVLALHRWQKSSRASNALPQGEQAYAQGNWEEAAEQFGLYIEVRNDDVPVLLKYAEAQVKRRPITARHIGHAITAYQSILRLNPGNAEAAKRLIELLLVARPSPDSPREAEKVALEYLQTRDDPELRRMLAETLDQQGKYPEAAKTLMKLVKDRPDAVMAYEQLGKLAARRPGDVNAPAADWFDKAVAANPQSAMAYITRGEFRRALWRRDQALADFEQAAKCDLSDLDVHLRLAQELILVQAFDKAKEHLALLQAKMPKKTSLWQSWAAAVLSTGTPEEKTRIAESGLRELAAYPWDFMPTAVELFVAANQPEKALECISRMRDQGLQPGLMTLLDGLVASSKGNLWEAASCWRDALGQGLKTYASAGGLGPRMPMRLMLASTYEQLGDIQSASVQLQTLVTEDPRSFEGRMALARLMIRTRNWAGARDQAREVQRLIPGYAPGYADAVLLEMRARILLLGDADEPTRDREQDWRGIEKQLAQLDTATQGAVQVKLLMAQAMDKQGKSAEAIKLLEDIRSKTPSDLQATFMEVDVLAGQEKLAEATALMRAAVEQFPQATAPVQTLAMLLNRQKDSQQCEAVIKQAIARMQQPQARRDLGLFLASLYQLWSRNDDLYRWLTDMAGQFPNDIQVKRRLLTCPSVTDDAQQAQALVDQIKALEGQAGWQWRYEQARIWVNSPADPNVRTRYYTQATALLQENLQANPNDQASRLLLGAAHENAGRQQLALSAYREAYSRAPDNIVIILRIVAALQRSRAPGDGQEAERILQQASARQLYHPDLEQLELQGKARRGDLESASKILKQLVDKDPNDVRPGLGLATICIQQEKLDEAEAILKDLQIKAPQSIAVAQTRVQLHLRRGNTQEAVRLCDETVQNTNGKALAYLLRAWTYASLREQDKAAADFAQAVAQDPGNAAIWVSRARFYQAIGQRDETIQSVRKALGLSAGNRMVLNDAIPLCLVCGSARLAQEAEATLDKARVADANDPELKLLKAQFYLSRGARSSIEQGQRLLREVTADQPQLSRAWYLLGRSEMEQEQPGALNTALGGLSHNERDRDLLLLKAEVEAKGSPALAVPTLRQLAAQYPNDVEIESRLAKTLYKSGAKNEGRAILEARMKAEPNNPVPPATLAGLLALEGRWTEVTGQVTNWLAKHPQDTSVVLSVARSLTEQGGSEALKTAESLLAAAVQRNPKSIPAVTSLAMLVQSMGRMAEAATLNRKALELDPNNIIALNNLAWILCEQDKQYDEALNLANRGLKAATNYTDLLDTRGVIVYRLGQFDKAVEDFRQCVELYPANARALASAYFHLGQAYAKMGRASDAEKALGQARDLHDRATDPTKRLSPEDLAEMTLLLEQLQKGR